MKRSLVIGTLVALACAGSAILAGIVGPDGPSQADRAKRMTMPARIVNHVVDLLDDELLLSSEEGSEMWESEPFDTRQFNRIGLRFSAEMEDGVITCRVCWRYGLEDEAVEGVPSVTRFQYGDITPPPDPDPGPGSGVIPAPDRERQVYLLYPYTVDFAEVRGLQAVVRCSLGPLRGSVFIGDDPSIDDPPPEPEIVTALVTDVKVLLRRD